MKRIASYIGGALLFTSLFSINNSFGQQSLASVSRKAHVSLRSGEEEDWISPEIKRSMSILDKFGVKQEDSKYLLSKQGINPASLQKLYDEKKVDLVDISSDTMMYERLAVTSDYIAVGRVLEKKEIPGERICYHSHYKIQVLNVIKNSVGFQGDVLTVVSPNGVVDDTTYVVENGSKDFELNSQYLFYLSQGYLEFYHGDGSQCEEEVKEDEFTASDSSPEIKSGLAYLDCPINYSPKIPTPLSSVVAKVAEINYWVAYFSK